MIKKGICIVIVILIFSCGGGSDRNNSNNASNGQTSFNPPSWIKGTWCMNFPDLGCIDQGFEFRNDDFCSWTTPTIYSCWKENLENSAAWEENTGVYEESSSDRYFFIINYIGGSEYQYEFVKISNTIMISVNTITGETIGEYIKL